MKKFLIIGNPNAITYNCIFPQIAKKEVFVRTSKGTNHMGMWFHTNSGELKEAPSVWFTTLDSKHLYKTIELTKTYDPAKYPRYDNYDAINVNCVKDIPYDYPGVMGVPISVLLYDIQKDYDVVSNAKVDDKIQYCRVLNHNSNPLVGGGIIDGKITYKRIPIRRKDEENVDE